MTELDCYLPYVTEDNNKEINSSMTCRTTKSQTFREETSCPPEFLLHF